MAGPFPVCHSPSHLPCTPHPQHRPPSSWREKEKGTYVIVNRGSDVLLKQLPIPIMSQQPLCWLCVCCPQAGTKPSHESPSHQNPRGPVWLLTQGTISFSRWLQKCPSPCPWSLTGSWQLPAQTEQPKFSSCSTGQGEGKLLGGRADLTTLYLFPI